MAQRPARDGGSRSTGTPYRRPLRLPDAPPRRHSPWLRVGLAAAIVATLPFAWSEDFKCEPGPQPLVSGIHILFKPHFSEPAPGIVFLATLALGALLGFAAARTGRPWRRFAAELVAALGSVVTTGMCVLMMTYGRPDQPLDHPAAWIGTLASLAVTVQAWFLAGAALREGIDHRRARREAARRDQERRRIEHVLDEAVLARVAGAPTLDDRAGEELEALAEVRDPEPMVMRRR